MKNPQEAQIAKIVKEMECTTKSFTFKRLHDLGLSISKIAKATNSHYSFVHGVVRKYEEQKAKDQEKFNLAVAKKLLELKKDEQTSAK